MKPDDIERRSRDTRPQPARRNAAPSKAALLLLVFAACAGPARALECWGELRPDGTVEWHDQSTRGPLLIAEHGSHLIDEGTNAMARGDAPTALKKFEEAARFLIPVQVRETEQGAEALARLHESSFRFGSRMVDAATNALQRGESAEAGEAFAAAKRFLEICRGCDADDARPRPILANLDARRLATNALTKLPKERKSDLADIAQALTNGQRIDYSSLTNILGSAQETKEFSVPFHLWFFDDGTCLVVSETGWGSREIQRFHWIDCDPGQFDLLMIYHPLPAELKSKLRTEMDLEALWKLLGPDDGIDITGSGTALFLWYFDDDTCLVTGKTGYEQHAFFHCEPGRYPRGGKGMEDMRIDETAEETRRSSSPAPPSPAKETHAESAESAEPEPHAESAKGAE